MTQKDIILFNNFLYRNKQIEFYSIDFKDIDFILENSIFFIDPPYLIQQGFYFKEFTILDEKFLLEILQKNIESISFVYFNYISYTDKDGEYQEHSLLKKFIENNKKLITIKNLRNKAATGQNRKGTNKVEEIIIIKE